MSVLVLPSPLGQIRLRAEGGALRSLQFDGGEALPEMPADPADQTVLEAAAAWVARYFRGEEPGPTPPLLPAGTEFQRRVWALTASVPRGETRSYGELARALGSSPRAVGAALARNPILLMIPCHRVLGQGGRLTGFAAGLPRKQALLRLEGHSPIP